VRIVMYHQVSASDVQYTLSCIKEAMTGVTLLLPTFTPFRTGSTSSKDDLVKVWILGTLEESLQDQVVTTPGNAKALWDHIKDLFHDNKDARAITLDGELRSIKLGSLTINAYCTKIKAMADCLANLGEKFSDKNLVMYALNGLDTRYKGIARLIRHNQPLPKFETARNMLLLEESNLQEATDQANTYDSSSSSPTVLMASKTDTKAPNKPISTHGLCTSPSSGPILPTSPSCPAPVRYTTSQSEQRASWTRTGVLSNSGYNVTKRV
nr:hybrid signal transduction histidine kinase M [Tanacetum cinerariifolium]